MWDAIHRSFQGWQIGHWSHCSLMLVWMGGWGMGVVVCSEHSAAPSSSCWSSAPVWGPSHGIQSFTDFFNMGPSHRLQFFKNCSSVSPSDGIQSSGTDWRDTAPDMGPSPWAAAPARSLLLAWAVHGLQHLSWHTHLIWRGVIHRLCVDISSHLGFRATTLLTVVFSMGYKQISAPGPAVPPLLSSLLHLAFCIVASPSFKSVLPKGTALGSGRSDRGAGSWSLLTEGIPTALLFPCPLNFAVQTQYSLWTNRGLWRTLDMQKDFPISFWQF